MTGNTDLIENLEEFTKVHHGILDAAMSIGDLSQMYGELLAYAGFVEARYPAVHKEAMLCAERIAQARKDRELDRDVG
jgi:hypothetical protein